MFAQILRLQAFTSNKFYIPKTLLNILRKEFVFDISKSKSKDGSFRYPIFFAISSASLHKLSNRCFVYCKPIVKNRPKLLEETNKDVSLPWKKLFKLLLPDIWWLIGALISALMVAYINTQIPLLLGSIVNILTKYTSNSDSQQFQRDMKMPSLNLITLYLFQGLLTFVYISLLSTVGERLACRMRSQLFESIIVQDMHFFNTHRTGDIVGRLTVDVQEFKSSFKMIISQGIKNITQIGGCLISLFILSPKLTLSMVGVVSSIIVAGSMIGSGLRILSHFAQIQFSRVMVVAEEAVGNISTVRSFAAEDLETGKFKVEANQSSLLNQKLGYCVGAFQGLSNISLNGLVLGMLYIGGYMMSNNEVSAGTLMTFLVATQTIQRSLGQLSMLFGHVVKGTAAGARVFEFMGFPASMNIRGGLKIPFHSLVTNIRFENVSFHYPSREERIVLENLNLSIPAGKTVALVGMSGGGKSTIASLLSRLYDPCEGRITLDGVDLKLLDPSWLRGQVIGFISQEPILFATSLMENIRYGKPDASDYEVEMAAKKANAHEFITSFPRGYHTKVGERGSSISAGQKQRVAIARALIKNPSILILDEATSALDSESEKIIQDTLETAAKGRTVLIIAHRLSTIHNADVIVVLKHGSIVEQGSHKELMKKKGSYYNLNINQESKSAL